MKMSKFTTVAALLTIIGFVYTDGSSTTTDYRSSLDKWMCRLEVETVDVDVSLNPSVCGQSSVTVNNVQRGFCKNNGDNCLSMHWRHTETLYEQCCIAKTATIVTGTVGVSGCSETVTYRFTNVTDCQCKLIQASTRT